MVDNAALTISRSDALTVGQRHQRHRHPDQGRRRHAHPHRQQHLQRHDDDQRGDAAGRQWRDHRQLGTGNIVDNGTLAINHSDTVTLGKSSAAPARSAKLGTGTTILTGTNTYTGTTTISAGTLQVGNGGTTGTLGTGIVTDNSALVFNRSDAVTSAAPSAAPAR